MIEDVAWGVALGLFIYHQVVPFIVLVVVGGAKIAWRVLRKTPSLK